MDKGDERKRSFGGSVEINFRRHQNRGFHAVLGMAWQVPTYWSCGVRRREGMTLIRAFVRNLRTWLAMVREKAQVEDVGSGNSEPPIPEILSRSVLEGKTSS